MERASLLPPQIVQIASSLGGEFARADDAETLSSMVARAAERRTV